MITLRTKNRYSRKEKNFMLDILIAMQEEVQREAKCLHNDIKDCRNCRYKNVCKDIHDTVHYLETI